MYYPNLTVENTPTRRISKKSVAGLPSHRADKSETMATTEVINAVQQLLEEEGVLQQIRAQLRSSVINALNSKTADRKVSKANEALTTATGRCAMLCVMDLMQKLNLRESLSVFEAEVGTTRAHLADVTAKDAVASKLAINDDEPALYDLVQKLADGHVTAPAAAGRSGPSPSPSPAPSPAAQHKSPSPRRDNTFSPAASPAASAAAARPLTITVQSPESTSSAGFKGTHLLSRLTY